MDRLRRRELLATVSATAAIAVAGCEDQSDETDGAGSNGNESANVDESNETEPEDGAANGDESTDEEGEEPDEPETNEEAATLFVEDLANGRFERAHDRVAPAEQDGIAVGQLEQIWMGYEAAHGEFREVTDTEEGVQSGFDTVDVAISFERGEDLFRIVLEDLRAAGLYFAGEYDRPEYVDTGAFAEGSITLQGDGCLLPGTVTTPVDETDVPGVVIVHGSGPTDRNADNGATRMYQDLAEGLASRGIATLRYDKRTLACQVRPEDYTLDRVTVDDALLAVDELRDTEGVDADRVAVVGHSLGGLAAPRIADRDGDLAGVVALAAPYRSFADLTVDQQEHHATVGEHEWDQMTEIYERWADRIDRIREGDYNPTDSVLGYPGAFWDSLEDYDHVETARGLDAPTFLLQGERDYQVSPTDDFEQWRGALEDRPETELAAYDSLNHLFMPGEGPSVQYEYFARNNVDERVVDDIADWIGEL